jgi:signal peptidase I
MRHHKPLYRTILEPIAAAVVLAVLVRAAVHIYSIPSRSMAPTLEPGDQILVTRYLNGAPQRGHVVVFEGRNELLVKRVIAVPGDLVDSRLGRVRIGGYTLAEPYLLKPATSGAIDAQLVPADSYFVLGDNRDDSIDSRNWGVVPRERIVGRARMVLWSSASSREVVHATEETPEPATSRRRGGLFKWID